MLNCARSTFLTLLIFCLGHTSYAEVFQKETGELIELTKELSDIHPTLEKSVSAKKLGCNLESEAVESFEQFIPCDQELAQVASLRYAQEASNLASIDRTLKSIFHQKNLTIKGKIFGTSISSDFQNSSLHIDTQPEGLVTIDFGTEPDVAFAPFSMTSQSGTCRVVNPLDIQARVQSTIEMKRRISSSQYRKWKSFCRDHQKYEEIAQTAKENDWEIEGNQDDEMKDYRGCPPNLDWKGTMYRSFCANVGSESGYPLLDPAMIAAFPNLNLPKSFSFFFDGFGDFNAQSAILAGAVNVSGNEGANPLTGQENGNGLHFFNDVQTELQINGSDFPLENQLFYYDGSGLKTSHNKDSAYACFQDMQEWIDLAQMLNPNIQRPKTAVLGYSNGGDMALDFQHTAGRRGREIDLLITKDPIPNLLGYFFRGVLPGGGLKARHQNTQKHLNFYQDSNYGLLYDRIDLQSQASPSADENIHLQPSDWGRNDGYAAHVYLLRSPELLSRTACEMKNLHQEVDELCVNR